MVVIVNTKCIHITGHCTKVVVSDGIKQILIKLISSIMLVSINTSCFKYTSILHTPLKFQNYHYCRVLKLLLILADEHLRGKLLQEESDQT